MRAAFHVLACSVRGCGLPLERDERTLRCTAGHAFDVARSGYVNLLQPQDRRSLAAGDSKEVVNARLALEERGLGVDLEAAIAELGALAGLARASPDFRGTSAVVLTGANAVPSNSSDVLDLGAGTGRHLAALSVRFDCAAVGLDLSVHAIELAARRHGSSAWCVANCDRVLPVRSASVDLVLSIDARRPTQEIARVLRPGGRVIVAVPGARDLAELREVALTDARDLPGLERVQVEFAADFELVARRETIERIELDARGLQDLSLATYRAGRRSEGSRVEALAGLVVTVAHEIGLFARRRG